MREADIERIKQEIQKNEATKKKPTLVYIGATYAANLTFYLLLGSSQIISTYFDNRPKLIIEDGDTCTIRIRCRQRHNDCNAAYNLQYLGSKNDFLTSKKNLEKMRNLANWGFVEVESGFEKHRKVFAFLSFVFSKICQNFTK